MSKRAGERARLRCGKLSANHHDMPPVLHDAWLRVVNQPFEQQSTMTYIGALRTTNTHASTIGRIKTLPCNRFPAASQLLKLQRSPVYRTKPIVQIYVCKSRRLVLSTARTVPTVRFPLDREPICAVDDMKRKCYPLRATFVKDHTHALFRDPVHQMTSMLAIICLSHLPALASTPLSLPTVPCWPQQMAIDAAPVVPGMEL